ncbi:short-chain dehydrogenase [Aureimonas endophytica]|uniref:Short-chain dehydrogenase n=1 Tax=Aureimonas endophytica TaxID=2027858 RepID=A0A917E7T1_9HYPH|nr:SDR family oxidoreductase [Aureimonas endophytica]GGE09222.1 short-chain dehydrogenase [Aureimonas endophytica]
MSSSASKRVVITGASSGIGAATAEAFARRGARLVLAARNGTALDEVAGRCRGLGAEVLTVPTDVTDAEAVQHLADRAAEWLGAIDLWFSNVGVGVVGKFHEVPLRAHRQVVEANLLGHLHDAYAVLPIFLRQKRGIFVNMISIGGFVATPWAAAYAASKFGLRGLSQALRGELSAYPDIHVCDIYPTFVDTPAIRHAGNYAGGETSVPPGVLDPRTVARAVVRLADAPRPSTGIGAPTLLMKLGQVVAPDLGASAMNGFLGRYFGRATPAPATDGNLFAPPATDGRIDGGFRRPGERRTFGALAVLGGLAGVALLAARLARRPGARDHR